MKRRSFISYSAMTTGLFLPSMKGDAAIAKIPYCAHRSNEVETVIAVPGLPAPVNVLMIADSHISVLNEKDKAYTSYGGRMDKAFIKRKHFKTNEDVVPADCFKALMSKAVAEKVDLIALVGDIVNNPASGSVQFVEDQVRKTGLPFLYTAGNHDWHYEGLPGSANELRDTWCKKVLKPLYNDNHHLYSSRKTGGVNMVFIDNSTYQISPEQVEFYKKQVAQKEPIALFVHIPLYMPTMSISCGHPEWGYDTDNGYETERRERWPRQGNLSSTNEFIKLVNDTPKLAGVFSGHWHKYFSVTHGSVTQHLSLPAFNGGYRMISFVPAV